MAWHNMQQTMKLLTALQDMGKQQKGTKGNGKAAYGGAQLGKKKFCPWADCTAAQKHHATVGGGPNCHSCRRAFSQVPPLERLVDWAYQEKLNTSPTLSKGEGKGKGQKGQGKGKGKDTSTHTAAKEEPSAEELRLLREQRLTELKGAKAAAQPNAPQAEAAGAKQQRLPQEPGKLDADSVSELEQVQPTIKEILLLVAADLVVAMPETQDPEATLASHMSGFSPCTTVEAKAELEARLAETKGFLAATNAPKVRARLQEQLDEDEKELSQLCRRGSPSAAQEASSLREALQALDRLQNARFDKEQAGRNKASERTEKRTLLLETLQSQVDVLKHSVGVHEADQLAKHEAKSQILSEQEKAVAELLLARVHAADAETTRLQQLELLQQQQLQQ